MNTNEYIWGTNISMSEALDQTKDKQEGSLIMLNRLTRDRYYIAPIIIDHLFKILSINYQIIKIPKDFVLSLQAPSYYGLIGYSFEVKNNIIVSSKDTQESPLISAPSLEFLIEMI